MWDVLLTICSLSSALCVLQVDEFARRRIDECKGQDAQSYMQSVSHGYCRRIALEGPSVQGCSAQSPFLHLEIALLRVRALEPLSRPISAHRYGVSVC